MTGRGQRPAWTALIEEEFGDDIMGDATSTWTSRARATRRATASRIGLTGKFLPFKYYGATGNALAYGLTEE